MPTVKELKEKCRDRGIRGYSKLSKSQLETLCVASDSRTGGPLTKRPSVKSAKVSAARNSKRATQLLNKCLREFARDTNIQSRSLRRGVPVWTHESRSVFWRKAPKRLDDFFAFGHELLHCDFRVDIRDTEFVDSVKRAWGFIHESLGINPDVPILTLFSGKQDPVDNPTFDALWKLSKGALLAFLTNYVARTVSGGDTTALTGARMFLAAWKESGYPPFNGDYSWLYYQGAYAFPEPSVRAYFDPMNAYYHIYEGFFYRLIKRDIKRGKYIVPLFLPDDIMFNDASGDRVRNLFVAEGVL